MSFISLIFGSILAVITLAILGTLSIYSLVTPFVAASVTAWLSYYLHLSAEGGMIAVITVYLGCTLLQIGLAKQDLLASHTAVALHEPTYNPSDVDKANAARTAIITIVCLFLTIILPIPKLPTLGGPLLFILIICLTAYSSAKQKGSSFGMNLLVVVIQSTILAFLFDLVSSTGNNPILGLISALALPAIVLSTPQSFDSSLSTTPVFRFIPTFLCCFIALAIPGYSISSIGAAIFDHNQARTRYISVINGVMEGWVLNQLCRSSMSGKTPLGDILSSRPFLLGDDYASPIFTLCVVFSILLATVGSFILWQAAYHSFLPPAPPYIPYRFLICFGLLVQSLFTIGMWTIPFLVGGFLIFFVRLFLIGGDKDTLALAFLVPITL
jgi:hypothetical protein